jgi:hypothetical protein
MSNPSVYQTLFSEKPSSDLLARKQAAAYLGLQETPCPEICQGRSSD